MTDTKAPVLRMISAYVIIICMMFCLCGCEAFARKFTRKHKKDQKPAEPMVLAPESYEDRAASKEDAYRQYFMYWSSWHDELIETLSDESPSMRRQLDNIQQAVNNLTEMQKLLSGDMQAQAGKYLVSMNSLKAEIERDLYGNNAWSIRRQAENLKRQINRSLQYDQVKDTLQ